MNDCIIDHVHILTTNKGGSMFFFMEKVEYVEIPIKNAVKLMDGEHSTFFFSCSFFWGPCFEQSNFVLQKLSLVSSYSRDLSDLRP